MNPKDLPLDRLATTDEKGNRIYLYPADVRGKWSRLRSRLSVVLIAIFLGLPWVKVGGHQALLFDIPNRRFAIFGLTFWAHDAPLLIFVFGGAVISIAFVTAIWGRVWCGWACPQTVFVEQVFRRIERWIEGDALARRRLDEGAFTSNKIFKKLAKWGLFSTLALLLSHSFLAYFVGVEELGRMMESAPSINPTPFLIMAGISSAILFDFGWFREQFCTVVCPYGRFQSVLMDERSTVVAYDISRGEPRRGLATTDSAAGDCVNCYRCVQVCPTGIDIRRGTQLECVACTACMDVCDDVMAWQKKPLGLIRYGDQSLSEGKNKTSVPWFRRTRAWIYLGLLLACILGLTLIILNRSPIEMSLIRAAETPYQEIPNPKDGGTRVLNHFKLGLRNQTFDEQEVTFTLEANTGADLVISNFKNILAAGESERADVFIQFPKTILNLGKGSLLILVEAKSKKKIMRWSEEARLVGPYR